MKYQLGAETCTFYCILISEFCWLKHNIQGKRPRYPLESGAPKSAIACFSALGKERISCFCREWNQRSSVTKSIASSV